MPTPYVELFDIIYTDYSTQRALYVGTTFEFSLEQRHDPISTTFRCCSNVRCPLGSLQSIPKSPPVCRIFSANLCFIRKVHILIRRMEEITIAIFRVRIRVLSFRYFI